VVVVVDGGSSDAAGGGSGVSGVGGPNEECAICREDMPPGQLVKLLPCLHRFHGGSCLDPWLRISMTCPVCKARV
jgi:hypothetical protein